MLTLTDISHWEGQIDFVKMKSAGVVGVYIKASEDLFTDANFLVNWQKAKDAGLLRGAFHFLGWSIPAQDQAEYFCDLLTDPGELPPCIDYEKPNPPIDKVARLQDALSEVYDRFGRALLYTGPSYWVAHGSTDASWLKYPLWNAHWTANTSDVIIPAPWTQQRQHAPPAED